MKTKIKYTPGPWKIGDVRSTSISIETVATHHVNAVDAMSGRDLSGERTELVARAMNGGALAPGVGELNAKVLAAAPALLEAAKRYLKATGSKPCAPETLPCSCEDCELRLAIRQAEGE